MKKKLLILVTGLLAASSAYGNGTVKRPTPFRTYVSIEGISKDTMLEISLPGQKTVRPQETGQRFEVPNGAIESDSFKLVVQMDQKGHWIKACEINVEQVSQFDRRYSCAAVGIPNAQVEVRVFTNLHGGDKLRPRQVIAKR